MGRDTHKRAEADLTEEERLRLNEARQVVLELSSKEPPPEALTELGYEQRMARMKAADLATQLWISTPEEWNAQMVASTADTLYDFIWEGTVIPHAEV